ncbi:unnamed protein product [Rhizoctonia solani]|uniref:Uncharacterized protein n=1 Tax=Rhizoctonia solani TaxID=456999 RepID=A0A8H2X8V7_9AGAM|nr:unnamed protein product [Rhizoctonia solani]
MPHVNPSASAVVMIKDENGAEQPWPLIPRPETIEKNCNIKKLMELGNDSESDSDEAAEDDTTRAQKAIYRSICTAIRRAMNAIVPDALHGMLKWKDITSAERSGVHETRQLRHARDTAMRKVKKNKALNLKPLDHLSKKSRMEAKKTSLRTKKKAQALKTTQVEAPVASVQAAENKAPSTPDSSDGNSQSALDEQSNSLPLRNLDAGDRESNGIETPSAPMVPDAGKQHRTLLAYFKPKAAPQPTFTANKEPTRTQGGNKNKGVARKIDSDSEDEDWSRAIEAEIADLNSKPGKPSARNKGHNATPGPSTAGPSNPKRRPKQRPPPSATDTGEEQDLFRRTTRASNHEATQESEAVAAGPSKAKSALKGKNKKKK